MQRRSFLKNSLATSTGLVLAPMLTKAGWLASGKDGVNSLADIEKYFVNPPSEARPWVFWQWMNGNVTKQGITLDLEAMKQMGIGGALCFNNAVGIPRGPVDYASKEWLDCTEHAAKEAQRLGLKLMLHNGPGYSGTGGPWVTPEMSMQQLVWTEALIPKKGKLNIPLPKPYAKHQFYQDAFVIAYPSLAPKVLMKDALLEIKINNEIIDKGIIIDGNPETKIRIEPTENKEAILELQFNEPFEARAISILRQPETPLDLFDGPRDYPPLFTLQASDDGVNFREITKINMPALREMDTPGVQSFDVVKAKYFRLLTKNPTWISNIELHTEPRLPNWPAKTNYGGRVGADAKTIEEPQIYIPSASVIDISEFMDADGNLSWKAPKSKFGWTILRIGHTTTGEEPAAHPDSAKGLEIDKLDRAALDLHFDKFLNKVLERLMPYKGAFQGVTTDSWEAGKQNWTKNLPQEFKSRRNYDIVQWLPTLTGRIVSNVEETERFLWDFRKTQTELLAQNYSGYYSEKMHQMGLQYHAEPYGDGTFDSLEVAQHLDVPMSEFWTRYIYGSDMTSKQAASAGHIYGKPIVAAEAFTGMPLTSKWTAYPYALKAEGDYFFTLGVNRLVFHVFVHQPYTTALPGMTMGPFGTHFDRNNTWTKQAHGWLNYVTRAQNVLQQGISVIDVCYFKGDNPESGIPDIYPLIPDGYKADVIGTDALKNRFSIRNGKIILPDGMQYQMMVMPALEQIMPQSLNKIKDLVAKGMILLVHNKPQKAYGLSNTDDEIEEIANEMYDNLDGERIKETSFGEGKIYWGKSVKEVLELLKVQPDFTYTSENPDAAIHYCHKNMDGNEVYFITNHKRKSENILCSFRVKDKTPEIWNAENGECITATIFENKEGICSLPLTLSPAGSCFVVFKNENQHVYKSVSKDGTEIIALKSFSAPKENRYEGVQNNFSISLWFKPDTFAHNNKSFLFHAPDGESVYGAGHAAVALSAGQNGVRVYERSKRLETVLFYEAAIEGYTHLCLLYTDGAPSIFINGKKVAEGKKSNYAVHPGLETPANSEQFNSYFEGNHTKPQLFEAVITTEKINAIYQKGLPELQLNKEVLFYKNDGKAVALFFENGKYQFSDENGKDSHQITACKQIPLSNPWQLTFEKGRGVDEQIEMSPLISLHKHPNFNIKHFSGTVSYQTHLNIKKENLQKDKKLFLDLGRVEVIAEVSINGKKMGNLWKEPFLIDITSEIKQGINDILVEVTNLWPNRLIGDEYLPVENEYSVHRFVKALPAWYTSNKPKPGKRITFSTWKHYDKTDPLLESGLLGPVHLKIALEKEIN